MAKYLLDTNIVLRFSNPSDTQHDLAKVAVATLLMQGKECYLASQVLIELWVVATRPTDVNGLGWSIQQARNIIDQLLERFPIIEETFQIFPTWLNVVTENQIRGKRTHDARIVALMLISDIDHVLTLNPNDFSGIAEITVVHPREILESSE
jgi:predicted nucleic acid-binding protein